MRRVLHLLGTAQPADAAFARVVRTLAPGMLEAGYQTEACFIGADGPLREDLESAGIQAYVLRRRGRFDLSAVWRLRRWLREGQYDLVHQHVRSRAIQFAARPKSGPPWILHVWSHLREPEVQESTVDGRGVDAVIAASRTLAGWVKGASAQVIYEGVPLPHPVPRPRNSDPIVGCAARLVPMKGISYLLRAVYQLRKDGYRLRLEIAGVGPLLGELKEQSVRLGIADIVDFLGWQPELARRMACWDLYVQPSLIEPYGLAALEAMALGLPVIATAGAGLGETVVDGETGWLVPPGDVVTLARAIRKCLQDRLGAERMGLAGRQRVQEHFTVDRTVRQLVCLYDDLLHNRARPSA